MPPPMLAHGENPQPIICRPHMTGQPVKAKTGGIKARCTKISSHFASFPPLLCPERNEYTIYISLRGEQSQTVSAQKISLNINETIINYQVLPPHTFKDVLFFVDKYKRR